MEYPTESNNHVAENENIIRPLQNDTHVCKGIEEMVEERSKSTISRYRTDRNVWIEVKSAPVS